MKKIITVLVTFVMLASLSITAFADLGQPAFENWYVVCGMDGYDYEEAYYIDGPTEKKHLEPGDKVQVYDHGEGESGEEYLLVKNDTLSKIYVTENELNTKFIDVKKALDKEKGTKLGNEVKGKVTADGGLVLRQGPATKFQAFKTIPKNTELSYQYTYNNGGHEWGYVTYNGTSGWVATEYVKNVPATNAQATSSATNVAAASSAPFGAAETGTQSETTAVIVDSNDTSNSFFSETKNVVIFCCMGAIILVLTAVIILILVNKNKEQKNMMQNNYNPNNYNNNYNQNPNNYNPNNYDQNGYNQDNRR